MGRELTPNRIAPFTPRACAHVVLCGISTCFQVLSPCLGQIVHALLTRPPLEYLQHSSLLRSRPLRAFAPSGPVSPQRSVPEISPLDLHVLSTPPAFVLSQDQTLAFNPSHRGARLAKAGLPPMLLTHQNLTVLSSFSRSRCIVFKDRFALFRLPRGPLPLSACI